MTTIMNELCTYVSKNSPAATPPKKVPWVPGRGQHAVNACYTLLVTKHNPHIFSHADTYDTPNKRL